MQTWYFGSLGLKINGQVNKSGQTEIIMCKKDEDVEHQYVKTYYNTNQYPEFTFCGPSKISHSVRRLSNHYKICFDTKLGHGTCEISHMT